MLTSSIASGDGTYAVFVGSHTYCTGDPSIRVWFCQPETPLALNEIARWGLPAVELASPCPFYVRTTTAPGTVCIKL